MRQHSLRQRGVRERVAALAVAGEWIVAGYRDGNLERLPLRPSLARQKVPFEQVPSVAPSRILDGPLGTLIVGYENGVVGIWNPDGGARLAHAQLHGPIVHLRMEDQKLFAATDLGAHLVWDLAVFTASTVSWSRRSGRGCR